jgi:diguanylate cyclase (GGDEF)-like protein
MLPSNDFGSVDCRLPTPPVRILVIHDRSAVREGLSVLLERDDGMKVVGSAATGEAAVLAAQRMRPDVIIMDLALPGLSGIDATRCIVREFPQTLIVALSASRKPENVYRALRAGARGYVLNTSVGAELPRAVKAVTAGKRYVSPAVTALFVDGVLTIAIPKRRSERSSTQRRDVSSPVVDGSTNSHVAQRLPGNPLLELSGTFANRWRMPVGEIIDDTQIVKSTLPVTPTVLIVDADDLTLGGLRELVAAAGYGVSTARSGTEALNSLGKSSASIIVANLNMPDMDGLDLCRRIREHAWPRYIYILLLTDRDQEEDIRAGLGAGADDYISKCASIAQLSARLRIAERVLALEYSVKDALHDKREFAMIDPLTGVYNRNYFMLHLNRELKRAQRFGGDVSLLLLDIDHFKLVNDTYGHAAGDLVLKQLTRQIVSCLRRATDWCARLGGQEFAVVLEGAKLAEAHACAEKLRQAIANDSIAIAANSIRITVSIGVSGLDDIGDRKAATVQSMLRRGDTNLFASKLCGRNRVTLPDSIGARLEMRDPADRYPSRNNTSGEHALA